MSDHVQIRMYNVGFGDCFLLVLPDKRTILLDSGFHSQGKGKFGGNDLAAQIIKDLKEVRGEARIDVVIATHRHQDHVYAFNAEKWSEVAVGEVWLPWVEDRSNPQAQRLWKKQMKFAMQFAEALPGFNLSNEDRSVIEFMLWNSGTTIPGFELDGWSNAGALDCLHQGFSRRDRAKPRFLPEKVAFPESFESPALPGVTVHVLGPPRDPELIEELDPESDGETYRALALRAAMAGAALPGAQRVPSPFGEAWHVPDDAPGFSLEADEVERLGVLAQGVDALMAAEKLDGMINSTSLVLMLEIGKAKLLLPGDAEWGTWKRILANEDVRTLLRGTTFLKVGHHGSHNATAKTLVQKVLRRKIPAMISTQEGPGNYRNNIPLKDLLTAMTDHGIHYVRSDRTKEKLPKGFHKATRWIDLQLPC